MADYFALLCMHNHDFLADVESTCEVTYSMLCILFVVCAMN